MESNEDDVSLPPALDRLTTLVEERIENFATGDTDLRDAALQATKYIFDLTLQSEPTSRPYLEELLDQIDPSQAPQTRAQARALAEVGPSQRKTLRHAILQPTPLSSLFIDGMDEEQVWAQLELKAKNICDTLVESFDAGDMDARGTIDLLEDDEDEDEEGEDEEDEEDEEDAEYKMDDVEEDEDMKAFANGQWEIDDDDDNDEDEEHSEEEDEEEDDKIGEEKVAELRDPSDEDEKSEEDEESEEDEGDAAMDLDAPSSTRRDSSTRTPKNKRSELDDDFFNLASFNAEILEAESRSVSRGALSKDSDEESDDEDVDLFAPVDNVEAFEEDDMEEATGDAYYKDFFEPPPKPQKKRKSSDVVPRPKSSKVRFQEEVKIKTIKNRGKGLKISDVRLMQGPIECGDDEYIPGDSSGSEDDDDEALPDDLEDEDNPVEASEAESDMLDSGREAVERLKEDLFADDEDDIRKSGLSNHESRMAAIKEQIAALEAENVAEKDWVLKGEVTSKARPQNGLLEEDLEFERITKPVPVVSEEVVQDLEARIKARIIESRFDDVERKRPVDDKPFLPSRIFELQDTKSKESLAQIYENEYVAAQNGGTTDDRDGKLQKEHEEIERLWENICYKLDALCNAHFIPKQPKATISTIANVSAVSLESALPTAKATSTILAPEEVFAPNETDFRAKSELTPAEKQALRDKERRRKKKQRDMLEKSVDKFAKANGAKSVKKQKEEALKSVVKSGKGVTVIGKKSQELKKGKKSKQS